MSANGKDSETFQPVTEDLDLGTGYCDVRLLHQGSRACVYTAMRAGKRLILKAPADESGRLLQLLQREYEIALNLSHPNIATIFTWEPDTPVGSAIVMEYVDGVTLQQWLAENPSVAQRNRIFEQLLDAVEYIHKCGVVHNDLKPENLLVSRVSGELKLIDFGMADNDANVVERKLGGTRGYTAPEISDAGAEADIRSDIYSIGVLMNDIFGRRYGRIARRCTSPNINCRYSNINRLRRRWQLRHRLPRVLISLLAILAVMGATAWYWIGYTERQHQESERKLQEQAAQLQTQSQQLQTQSQQMQEQSDRMQAQSQLLQDSIQMLSATQKNDSDSIGSLNAQLDNIKEQEAKRKALTEEYRQGVDAIGRRLSAEISKAGDTDYIIGVMAKLEPEVAKYNREFILKYGEMGEQIVHGEMWSAIDAQRTAVNRRVDDKVTELMKQTSDEYQH